MCAQVRESPLFRSHLFFFSVWIFSLGFRQVEFAAGLTAHEELSSFIENHSFELLKCWLLINDMPSLLQGAQDTNFFLF